MNRAVSAARCAGRGTHAGSWQSCRMGARTFVFRSGGVGQTLFQSAGCYRLLLSGCGVGFAGIWAASAGRSSVMCESGAVATTADAAGKVEPAAAGVKQASSLEQPRRRSWKRWLQILWRYVVLLCKFCPLVIAMPVLASLWRHGGEEMFWRLLLQALDSAGPTFVKLAQWASTRPDLLPTRAILHLSKLQARTHPHSYEQTMAIFCEVFGPEWEKTIQIDAAPVGSGCMGQVYHGWILNDGTSGENREVAIKVRHPGARDKIHLDLEIMRLLSVSLESIWNRLQLFSMSDFVDHFEAFIIPQADMRIEAANLDKFNDNFPFASTGRGLHVRFPSVVRPYVSEAVVVMTYERAAPMSELLSVESSEPTGSQHHKLFRAPSTRGRASLCREDERNTVRTFVGKICLDTFLQMMFRDQFIHGDMHPGNMMVRLGADGADPELIVIDTGLAVQMNPRDQRNFVDLLHAVAMRDGPRAGRLMVERSPGDRSMVIDEEVFVERVADLVHRARAKGLSLGKFGIADTLGQMLQLAYSHRVKLEAGFVTVVTSIVVLEGVSRQLDPTVDIIEAATPYLVKAAAAYAFGFSNVASSE